MGRMNRVHPTLKTIWQEACQDGVWADLWAPERTGSRPEALGKKVFKHLIFNI
jgi:hypothetical protein